MCGPLFWNYWWIFPVLGLLMCIGFLVIARVFAGRGMCMGGHRAKPGKDIGERG